MKKRQFFAGFAAAAIAASMMAVPVGASEATTGAFTYDTNDNTAEATTGGVATVTKNLIMDADANVPNVTLTYTLTAGTAVPQSSAVKGTSLEVYAGITTGATAGTVTFAPGNATVAETSENHSDYSWQTTAVDDEKVASKTFGLDFTGVAFNEPGVYRYVLTESSSNTNVTNIDNTARTVDVYVVDNQTDNKLVISNVVVYNDVITTAAPINSATVAAKSEQFNNKYESVDLVISKTVTGNQGSRDKYFKYAVTITSATDETAVYTVDLSNAVTTVPTVSANDTDYNGETNPSTITLSGGTATAYFYLQNGQSIKIQGLGKGTAYSVIETAEDYAATATVTGDTTGVTNTAGTDGTVSDTGINADTTVAYTNDRTGTIPTGVILTVAAPAVIGLGVLGLIVMLNVKKKREEAEE